MAQGKSRTQQLNGLPSLAYVGVMPATPINFFIKQGAPTTNDYRNCYVGDMWLDNSSMYAVPATVPTPSNLWVLVSVANKTASWINFFTNSGGIVISVVGGNNITITGTATNPIVNVSGTTNHSVLLGNATGSINSLANGTTGMVLTAQTGADPIWAAAAGDINTLTGNSGGAVGPTAGNINVVGTGVITVVGNPGTSTLTITPSGAIASSFPTDSGTATPIAGVLNIIANNAANNAGSSVLFSGATNVVTLNVTDALDNTNIGKGSGSLLNVAAAGNSTLIGFNAGSSYTTTENRNVVVGAGNLGRAGEQGCVRIGAVSGTLSSTGNIFIGLSAGNLTYTLASATANVCCGTISGLGLTTGVANSLYGNGSGISITSGGGNCGFGGNVFSAAIGVGLTTGSRNCSFGAASMYQIVTGSDNCCIGSSAGGAYNGAESSNIQIGSGVVGGIGESNVLRIGTGTGTSVTQLNKAFIAGIRGITTTNADAVAVLVDSANQLGTVSSTRNLKDNIVDMGSYSDSIRHLRPVVFNYKNHAPESKSVGLIAEEVNEVAPHLVAHDDKGEIFSVKYHDLVPMLLNEFQKHCELIASLQAMNCNLLDRIRMLEEENLKRRI